MFNVKRLGNVYPSMMEIPNIEIASRGASNNKRDREDVKEFHKYFDKNVQLIQGMLVDKSYKSSEYRFFEKNDKGKIRELADLPFFPDRIIHWVVMGAIEEMFLKHFIYNTYAAIPNKGPAKALRDLNREIRRNPNYTSFMKLDIKQFFPSIDKEILKTLLRKKIKDKDLLQLLDEVIEGYPKSGIPIGTYTSQYFGNYYLSFFDHWIKEELRVGGYFRYMDDMIFLGESKEELWELFYKIERYLWDNLRLEIKSNYRVCPIDDVGIDFVGYRSYRNKIVLRNSTKNKMIRTTNKCRKYKNNVGAVASYKGIVERTTSKGLYDNHIKWAEGVIICLNG